MNIEGRKVVVKKSVAQLHELLKSPAQYENLMPDGLQSFSSNENGFKFQLKGMPEIALNIKEVSEEQVILASGSSSMDFELTGKMQAIDAESTEVQLFFEGKFNPFIKMMVEKPLNNFIENLTSKLENL